MICFTATDCGLPIGISTGEIPSLSLLASSSIQNHEPHKARLGGGGRWCAARSDANPAFTVSVSFFNVRLFTFFRGANSK